MRAQAVAFFEDPDFDTRVLALKQKKGKIHLALCFLLLSHNSEGASRKFSSLSCPVRLVML